MSDISGRVAFLLSDGFGGFGGISKFNRDFLTALDRSFAVEQVLAFPRLIYDSIVTGIPESVVYDRRSAQGKAAFVSRVIAQSMVRAPIDLVICGHINLLPMACFLARAKRARLALIIHGIDAWSPPKSLLARKLVSRIDAFLSVSRTTAERFTTWSGIPMRFCSIVPNSVDTGWFRKEPPNSELIRRYGLEGRKVLLTVGRLDSRERYKGFDEVLQILPALRQSFPNLKYLIAGGGHDRARLEQKCRDLDIAEYVVFAGRIPESEKVAHYNLADVYVMPSSGEGFGIVLIEAAACGVPIVGSGVDGSREALLDGTLGRLVDPNNSGEICEAIVTSLQAGKPIRRNEAVETFGIAQFRRRVSEWIEHEMHAAVAARG